MLQGFLRKVARVLIVESSRAVSACSRRRRRWRRRGDRWLSGTPQRPRQAEISHLGRPVVGNEYITSADVTVKHLQRRSGGGGGARKRSERLWGENQVVRWDIPLGFSCICPQRAATHLVVEAVQIRQPLRRFLQELQAQHPRRAARSAPERPEDRPARRQLGHQAQPLALLEPRGAMSAAEHLSLPLPQRCGTHTPDSSLRAPPCTMPSPVGCADVAAPSSSRSRSAPRAPASSS